MIAFICCSATFGSVLNVSIRPPRHRRGCRAVGGMCNSRRPALCSRRVNRGALSLGGHVFVMAVVASITSTARADDPPPRRVEVGGFVGLDYFTDDIELGNSWAAEQIPGTGLLLGGRAGLILLPDLLRGRDADLAAGIEG